MNMLTDKRCVRRLHDLSFSSYLALLIILEETWKQSSPFLHVLGYPLKHYVYPLLPHLGHPEFLPSADCHSLALWLVLTVFVFVCVHFLGRITFRWEERRVGKE